MRLSDVMAATGLQGWAEIGLVVSFLAFVALLVYLFIGRRGRDLEKERWQPLDDARSQDPEPDETNSTGDRS